MTSIIVKRRRTSASGPGLGTRGSKKYEEQEGH
jgi:hypothetical protein